jgi:prephenate dehydrogenase
VKKLCKISVVGTGLLGTSITSAILCSFSHVKFVDFSYRPSIGKKASQLGIVGLIGHKMKSKEL